MTFEKRAWIVIDAIILLLVLLSTRLVYWQLVRGESLLPAVLSSGIFLNTKSSGQNLDSQGDQLVKSVLNGGSLEDLQNMPAPLVQRVNDLLQTIQRGSIYDRNGRLLATDRLDQQGDRFRFYTEPTLAHVIGSVSGLRIGISGLELTYNDQLLGLDRLDAGFNRMIHQPIVGSDLNLTIDSALQRKAEQVLDGRAGSVTVLDGRTGAILAMASLPRFDPNRVLENDYLSNLLSNCDGSPQCKGALLNRATQARYTPGSTWKTVSLIAALDTGQVTPQTVFDFGDPVQGPNGPYYVYKVGGGEIVDPNHKESKLPLDLAYAKSANAAFARIGDEMPPETLIDYAARLGFSASGNQQFPLDFDYIPGQLAKDTNSIYSNSWLRAATAIGQGELLASPLNMGMVVLSVLNDGNLPLPYLVQSVRNPSGTNSSPRRVVIRNIMKKSTAQAVRNMMVTVVKQGGGYKAAVDGLTVGGKTGTAQVGGDQKPHAWFIGYAEKGDRSVVIVVMIENGGEGSQVAAPIFADMARAFFQVTGKPVEETVPLPPEPTPKPSLLVPQPTQVIVGSQPTPVATQTVEGVPAPDIPYKPGKVDFTEQDPSCPGNQTGPVGSGKFIWPSVYQAVSGGKFQEGHPGIDLSAPEGSAVYAADAGLVIFAGWSGLGYGNAVVIDHGNGYKTLYAHLSQISQFCGAKVKAGQIIGQSGSTGNSSGPHLHFEVRVPGGYLDPLKVLPTP